MDPLTLQYVQKPVHITANGTVNVSPADAYLSWIKTAIIDGGTNWVIKLQDKASPPDVFACGSYQSNQQDIAIFFAAPEPVFMRGGMDIVASGATAGDVWVWIFGWFSKS